MTIAPISLDISTLKAAYLEGRFTPRELVSYLLDRASPYEDRNIWIKRFELQEIEPYLAALDHKNPAELPLFGIPFAVKDNIDVANIPTTAGCPEFAYTPTKHAFIVRCLIEAGAIPLGKTNLDQFATGLVGTRSPEPWGPCRNAFDPDYISGGSSSGSAVAVALGLVSFALGTDTAGSGRVPAMLNNLYGLKPSKGVLSMTGVVPACRSLDCPSIFALSPKDAVMVFHQTARYDPADAYSRPNPFSNRSRHFGIPVKPPTIGIPKPSQLAFFGNRSAEELYGKALQRWQSLGATLVELDFEPLFAAARLLYEGPWVAERYAAIEDLMQTNPAAVHPVVREILSAAESKTAVETFQYEYRMQAFRKYAAHMMAQVDFLMTPTAPTTYKVEELLENPIQLNASMGYYTNYMNLVDFCGIAIPVGFMASGIPFGVTLIGAAFEDQKLASYAALWERTIGLPSGATSHHIPNPALSPVEFSSMIHIAVCGAHLEGMPLNWQLTERGATCVKRTTTAPKYRLYALKDSPPLRPGLTRDEGGSAIEIELWSIPKTELGDFVANIPPPLGIGKIEVMDGSWVSGFICEPCGLIGAEEITHYGSWRAFVSAKR